MHFTRVYRAHRLLQRNFSGIKSKKILVTGSNGQIGSELIPYLCKIYGDSNIIASDVRVAPSSTTKHKFMYLDVLDINSINKIVVEEGVDLVIHMVAILSAVGEANPHLALKVNNVGTENVFETNTPDDCILRPTTMYGLTKIHTELLGEYYYNKYNLDFRSLRYPGVISSVGMPGGGTTDYAVDIYHKAVLENKFQCFLSENTALPMMYMPDLLKATVGLIEADPARLKRRVYNLGSMSFTPKRLTQSIQEHFSKSFQIEYKPDSRQAIADSWPSSIDDSNAAKDWGWKPDYNIDSMTKDMFKHLKIKYNK